MRRIKMPSGHERPSHIPTRSGALSWSRDHDHSDSASSRSTRVTAAPALAGGHPLDSVTRSYFESRLGHSFANVRIHDDSDAHRDAAALISRAFTVGPDISFGEGQYAPGTEEGRRLLAHELTHTVQQGSVRPPTSDLSVSHSNDPAERQADAA
jgi:hypothetical protein